MFVQIHMLQSMPPGNLNRDDVGQPKKCLFGGVTRGRISSQCLKRNIRHSPEFKAAFGDALADRTTYLPKMVGDALDKSPSSLPKEDVEAIMTAIRARFKKVAKNADAEEDDNEKKEAEPAKATDSGQTGQLVFFPETFAARIADLMIKFRKEHDAAYERFLGRAKAPSKPKKKNSSESEKVKATVEEEQKAARLKNEETQINQAIQTLIDNIEAASKDLTVDIGLFGRMTTSDLVVDVEASCQVAHAIGTHEMVVESDYFTAMDDRKTQYATSKTDKAGAAFLGSGETETFFNAVVYYKYLNVDFDALQRHLPSLGDQGSAKVADTLVRAVALATPTGKQNSFASHSVPELILVELSPTRRPLSYANAFLQPVEGPNYITQSADALKHYLTSVAAAFAPPGINRFLLTCGQANVEIEGATRVRTLDQLAKEVGKAVTKMAEAIE